MNIEKRRYSGIELFRLISILGIIGSHIYGDLTEKTGLSWFNSNTYIVFSGIFCFSVTGFILISGYFGLHASYKKLFRLNLIISLYGILNYFILLPNSDFSWKGFLLACVPILTRKNWFFTCYFALVLISPYLNMLIEHLSKKEMQRMLIMLVLIFCVFPIYPEFGITLDGGKGIVQMVITYMIGRYLKLYGMSCKAENKFCQAGIMLVLIIGANFVLTFLAGHGIRWMSSDNSILTILYAVFVFQGFQTMKWQNQIVNKFASCSMAILMLERAIRPVFVQQMDIYQHWNSKLLFVIIIGTSICIMIICSIIEIVRKLILTGAENVIVNITAKIWKKICGCIKEIDIFRHI